MVFRRLAMPTFVELFAPTLIEQDSSKSLIFNSKCGGGGGAGFVDGNSH